MSYETLMILQLCKNIFNVSKLLIFRPKGLIVCTYGGLEFPIGNTFTSMEHTVTPVGYPVVPITHPVTPIGYAVIPIEYTATLLFIAFFLNNFF